MACFHTYYRLISDSNADGVGVLGVGWMAGAECCLQMVAVWGEMYPARLLTKLTGMSSGLCQCHGS